MRTMTEPPTDRLTYALSILAGDPCIQIGQGMQRACRELTLADPVGAESECPTDASLATWLCDEALFFTLIKEDRQTLVFCHSNGVLYYATPQTQLAVACPSGTSILCQFTVDSLPGECTARLLAFDVLSPKGADPAGRGETLRGLAVHLPTPLCCVQWVGPRQYLTSQFLAELPHKTSGRVVLTPDSLFLVLLPSI